MLTNDRSDANRVAMLAAPQCDLKVIRIRFLARLAKVNVSGPVVQPIKRGLFQVVTAWHKRESRLNWELILSWPIQGE